MNLLLILAFLAGNLFKFSYFSPEVRISPLDLVMGVLWLGSLPKFSKPTIGFIVAGVISLLIALTRFNFWQVLIGSTYLLRWFIYTSPAYSFLQSFKVLPIVGIGTAILGLIQYVLIPDVRFLANMDWDPHFYRIVGTLLDPGFTGLILVFTMVYLVLKKYHKLWWVIVYVALALTYSRSSYLAFLMAFTWISWQKKTWKYFLVSLCLVSVTVTILPRWSDGEGVKLERTSTIWARIRNWQESWTIFSQNPILGVGFNTYRYARNADLKNHAGAGADSSLLLVLATTGVVGFVFYLKYLKGIWNTGKKNLVLSTSFVALLVHAWFLNSLFYPEVMVWLGLLISQSDS